MRCLAASLVATILLVGPAFAYKGERYAKDAKLSLKDARALALEAKPGRITSEALETKAGGSGLRYSFDIKAKGIIFVVDVDAKNAAILECHRGQSSKVRHN